MNCKNCQQELRPNTRFCSNCGTAVPEETPHFEEVVTPIPPTVNTKESTFPTEAPPPVAEDSLVEDFLSPTNHNDFIAETNTSSDDTAALDIDFEPLAKPTDMPLSPNAKPTPSQNTMDSIDLAVAHDMTREPVQFEQPPLYIPETKRRKAPFLIALLVVALLAGAVYLFVSGTITLPSFSTQSPLSLTNGKKAAVFDMTQYELEEDLGAPLSQNGNQYLYKDGISVIYRDSRAVQIQLGNAASKRWKTAGKISIGDSRSDIFKAYGTDNLVSVLKTMDRLDDPSKISQMDEYLIPYQKFDDGIIDQINTLNRDNYESNPDSYYWIAIRVDQDGIVDNISLGDSSGVFYHK